MRLFLPLLDLFLVNFALVLKMIVFDAPCSELLAAHDSVSFFDQEKTFRLITFMLDELTLFEEANVKVRH